VEGIINLSNLELSHDFGQQAKRAISPTLLKENSRVAKSCCTAPSRYKPKNKGVQILNRYENRIILSSKNKIKTLPMRRDHFKP